MITKIVHPASIDSDKRHSILPCVCMFYMHFQCCEQAVLLCWEDARVKHKVCVLIKLQVVQSHHAHCKTHKGSLPLYCPEMLGWNSLPLLKLPEIMSLRRAQGNKMDGFYTFLQVIPKENKRIDCNIEVCSEYCYMYWRKEVFKNLMLR